MYTSNPNTQGQPIVIKNTCYDLFPVPGDGNCFFHSLSFLLYGNFYQSQSLRTKICSHVLENWDEEKVAMIHNTTMTKSRYIHTMLRGNDWATLIEVEAAASILSLNINVFLRCARNDGNVDFLDQMFVARQDISCDQFPYVQLLLSNNHYQPIKPKRNLPMVPYSNMTYASAVRSSPPTCMAPHSNIMTYASAVRSSPPMAPHSNTMTYASAVKSSRPQYLDHTYATTKPKLPPHITDHTYVMPTIPPPSIDHTYSETVNQTNYPNLKRQSNQNENENKNKKIKIHKNIKDKKNTNSQPMLVLPAANDDEIIHVPENEKHLLKNCRKLGLSYEFPAENESPNQSILRKKRIQSSISYFLSKNKLNLGDVPESPPITENAQFDKALDQIRSFELIQMNYNFGFCSVCKERRLEMKMVNNTTCKRCSSDKNQIKMFSGQNSMDPGPVPSVLKDMTVVEQQLIARISPSIHVHMLKHGGIAAKGHCVTFPQDVNEPAKIFPRLPSEISIIKVKRQGKNDTSKDFIVRRVKIEEALVWLKHNNPVYNDITICKERLSVLPVHGELPNIPTVEFEGNPHVNDKGPAEDQNDPGDIEGQSNSCVLLPDECVDIRTRVENVVNDAVVGNNEVTVNQRGTVTIPWPTRNNIPLSEFTTVNFFTLAFPALFPSGTGDFHINRPITCTSMLNWADHLLWYEDGRFARHPYFKFIVHNMIMRKKALESSSFVFHQQLGDVHLTVEDLKQQIQNGDTSLSQKLLYFSASIRGTNQYWHQRGKELRSLTQFQINNGSGLPSFFTTGSCAEYHFKPLKRLLKLYVNQTTGKDIDLDNRTTLFEVLQANSHVVAHYFDNRTTSYFQKVMGPVFGVNAYWYRQEFAKSRGMVHWHGLCWRSDRQPHTLMSDAIKAGLSESECASALSNWAEKEFGMTAMHPAGQEDGLPRKNLWPAPEGTAPPPPDETNPLVKLLMDASASQDSLLDDYFLLTNRINLHRCSDYCMKKSKYSNKESCRMEFEKELRSSPAIVFDKNKSLRLAMPRDHPRLVQNSRFHTQAWRANGDISLILSKSDPDNPSVNDIIATERYITGYACKGNASTGATVDLFNDMINCSNDTLSGKSVCQKLLMETVKRDISNVEAVYELSSLPLYRSSHSFQNISFSGFRKLERTGSTMTKNTPLDRYLQRPEGNAQSLYAFICKPQTVPVVPGNNVSWPLHEDYARTTLLLHWPNWRKIEDIKAPESSWIGKLTEFLATDSCPTFVKAEIERARLHVEHVSDDESESESEEGGMDEWMEVLKPNAEYDGDVEGDRFDYDDGGPMYDWSETSIEYPIDNGTKWVDHLQEISANESDSSLKIPNVDVHLLNEHQRQAFNIIMKTVQQFEDHDPEYKPLRMIVGGTAGSGKSFLINCLVKTIRLYYQSNKSVQVLCPTGNSANLIDGVTLHSFLKIPTTHRGKDMKVPDGSRGAILQQNCEGVHVLLVDERSMIGATTLGWMEFLCRCGMKSDNSWGGIPVVVFLGDDVQLPPVLDSPVYQCSTTKKCPAAIHGFLVWKEFDSAIVLRSVVRQSTTETQLKSVLTSLRQYSITPDQTQWLQNFQWNNLRRTYGPELMDRMSQKGLFVFPSHAEVGKHNQQKLLLLNQSAPIAKITSISVGPHAQSSAGDKAGGLLDTIYLARNAKVMLTVNLCVSFGLYNGSIGRVVDILYFNNRSPPKFQPDVVMVEFFQYTGPPFVPGHPKVVPIVPVERRIDCYCFNCKRKQIPLRLGWAVTIHKCQGMTIGEGESNRYIVINPGTRSFESKNPGALFVALSRAKTAGQVPEKDPDFAWQQDILLNEDRMCHKVDTPTVRARNLEIQRIEELVRQTVNTFQSLADDRPLNAFMQKIVDQIEE